MTENTKVRDIEKQLVQKITSFLLELGSGFAFIGNQYKLNVGGEELFCKEKNKLIAEYSLMDMTKPMGVAENEVLHDIPMELKGSLPTIDEIKKNIEFENN